MAQVGHRVDYLAGFCCPVGGLAAGKPRVLCHENQIYLSNGTEYVYVYDQEGRLMKVRLDWRLVGPASRAFFFSGAGAMGRYETLEIRSDAGRQF